MDKSIVRERLEASRRDLLDTSLRNRLINYRAPKARGAEIIGEDPSKVFKILVTDAKPMTFIGRPDKKEEDKNQPKLNNESDLPASEIPPAVEPLEIVDADDLKLNTNYFISNLQTRLLKTWRDAQSSIDEQGVNILFLSLGMLEWYEADSSKEVVKSPLIFIPVLIERARGNKFQVKYEGTEVGENLSLAAKLAQEFNIKIPHLSDTEDLNVKDYLNKVADAVKSQKRWKVNFDSIVLSFFSYTKYLMFKDLEGANWPDGAKPWEHSVLSSLLEAGFEENEPSVSEDDDLDKHRPIDTTHEVVDADSSQILALLEARSGRSMVVEGPPGTGKSQTITNLIAEAIGEGKKVLFVSEKKAALEVVWGNLKRARLHETCLELHSNKTSKKTFYEKLKETTELGTPQTEKVQTELQILTETRDYLNAYCQAVHHLISNRGISPIQAMGQLVSMGQEQEGLRKPSFSIMKEWNNEQFMQRVDLVNRIQSKIKEIGIPIKNPYFGSRLEFLMPEDKLSFSGQIKAAIEKIRDTKEVIQKLSNRLSLSTATNFIEACMICRGAEKAASAPALEGVSVNLNTWNKNESILKAALLVGQEFYKIHQKFNNDLKPEAWGVDFKKERQVLIECGEKWWRFFLNKYWKARNKLSRLCQTKLPKSNNERIVLIDAILNAQDKLQKIQENQPICKKFFAAQWRDENSEWVLLLNILNWIIEAQKEVGEKRIPKELLKFLEGRYDREGLLEESSRGLNKCNIAEEALKSVLAFLKAEERLQKLFSASFEEQLARLNGWLEDISRLEDLISFNHLVLEAESLKMQEIVEIASDWESAGSQLAEAFMRSWYSGVLREACEERPQLSRFDRLNHEASLEKFRELDKLMLQHNQLKILLKHWQECLKI